MRKIIALIALFWFNDILAQDVSAKFETSISTNYSYQYALHKPKGKEKSH